MSERLPTKEILQEVIHSYGERVEPIPADAHVPQKELPTEFSKQVEAALGRIFSDTDDILQKKLHAEKQMTWTSLSAEFWKTEQCGDYEVRLFEQTSCSRSPYRLPLLVMHLGLHRWRNGPDVSVADFTFVFYPENRIGIVHRYVYPEYRDSGIGGAFCRSAELLAQRIADLTHATQYVSVKTAQPSLVVYFQDSRNFVPKDEVQKERINRMRSGDSELFLAPCWEVPAEGPSLVPQYDRGLYCFEGEMNGVPKEIRLPLLQVPEERETAAFDVQLEKEFKPSTSAVDQSVQSTRIDLFGDA